VAHRESDWRGILGGTDRSLRARLLRGLLTPVSWGYGGVMRLRNWKYGRGTGVRRLPRPVISVGNLTTGGTGKTPVVHWLCDRLRAAGERPAVLMRGYKAKPGEKGDEQEMLEALLNRDGAPPVPVLANPRRYEEAMAHLEGSPETSVFVLDDGFQHRRIGRDFDLVLIDATNPFGFGRVLPRGLLREPAAGVGRADAILITRADQVDERALGEVLDRLRGADVPKFRAAHGWAGVRTEGGESLPVADLAGRRVFALAGIGNPEGFAAQLAGAADVVGLRFFPDHHAYTRADVEGVMSDAGAAGAEAVVTTDKDWVKLCRVIDGVGPGGGGSVRANSNGSDGASPSQSRGIADRLPVWRVELAVRFMDDGADEMLLARIRDAIRAGLQSLR